MADENFDFEEAIRRVGETVSNNLLNNSAYKMKPFRDNDVNDPNTFIKQFEGLAKSCGWNDETKVSKLRAYLNGPSYNWYLLVIEPDLPMQFEEVKQKFLEEFDPENDLLIKLKNRKQLEHETVQAYVYDKVLLCQRLNENMTDNEVLNFLYDGLRDSLKKQVYLQNPSNFKQFLEIAKRVEATQKSNLFEQNSSSEQLNKLVQSLSEMLKNNNNRNLRNNFDQRNRNIFPRGLNGNPRCHNCGRYGHVARFCEMSNFVRFNQNSQRPQSFRHFNNTRPMYNENKSNFDWRQRSFNFQNRFQKNAFQNKIEMASKDKQNEHVNSISTDDDNSCILNNLIKVNVTIDNTQYSGILDTGSSISLINNDKVCAINSPIIRWDGPKVKAITGHSIDAMGACNANVQLKIKNETRTVHVKLMVVKNIPFDILLGTDFMKSMGIIISVPDNNIYFSTMKIDHGATIKCMNYNLNSKETVVLEPSISTKVKVVTSDRKTDKQKVSNICACSSIEQKLIEIKNKDITIDQREAELELCNNSPVPIQLNKGTMLAKYTGDFRIKGQLFTSALCSSIVSGNDDQTTQLALITA
ncbi:hypothetical protein B4U80_13688 [Leptotrombidium deliense]|uniref:CCHC-type domain-containing protein n=1 Tax=Leptotrombidium deliense TaxID=299467 RepID=A0A443SKQ1_9ACAR|nr:hypothetical protein B4U80_13688 [Leptotrombidium deliense]